MYGETSKFRYLVLAAATTTRPADFNAAALPLPELSTTDMPAQVSTKTDTPPKVYGSPAAGTAVTWQKPRPDTGSWTAALSGNVLPTKAERTNMQTMYAALGKYVWIERQMNTDDTWEGGCALVTSTGKPIPADGYVTFSLGLTGYGPKYNDTATIPAP
ncbi:hypothetical protein DEIPH_ctg041orf0010 [Deinococcus phoenicis]|uniref:Uncharacterized protein n=1 Tax=Deinococcus phoenicis TaxID=1476583 RepID=A0A016QNR2_9DEIO|nr:hypothetical protein DEIPH_ctg041orf0010 [Deinococcus phoenicis]